MIGLGNDINSTIDIVYNSMRKYIFRISIVLSTKIFQTPQEERGVETETETPHHPSCGAERPPTIVHHLPLECSMQWDLTLPRGKVGYGKSQSVCFEIFFDIDLIKPAVQRCLKIIIPITMYVGKRYYWHEPKFVFSLNPVIDVNLTTKGTWGWWERGGWEGMLKTF